MGWEVAAAAAVGAVVLWLVLLPLLAAPPAAAPGALPAGGPGPAAAPASDGRRAAAETEPLDPEETPAGVALAALKEIEFDRATGKLSEADYEELKATYTARALEALRAEARPAESDDLEIMIAAKVRELRVPGGAGEPAAPLCPACGPRPEPDAVFCSACGRRLDAAGRCRRCGAPLVPGGDFCEGCGSRVAA